MRALGATPDIPALWPHASGRIYGLPAIGAEVACAALLDVGRGDLAALIREDPMTGEATATAHPEREPDRTLFARALLLAHVFDCADA